MDHVESCIGVRVNPENVEDHYDVDERFCKVAAAEEGASSRPG